MNSVIFPMKVESVANKRECWQARARRSKAQRKQAHLEMLASGVERPELPCTIKIIRIGPRAIDSDNAIGGAKAVRDGIADWLHLDDGDSRVTWQYGQERGAPKQYAVCVEVTSP